MWRDALRGGPRVSLWVKLVAVTLCLLAAGGAVIVAVTASALRGQLTSQAGAQLRTYVNQLTSHSFQVLGTAQGAPVAAVPFAAAGTATGARAPGTAGTIGSPGAARMAGESDVTGSAETPSAIVAGIDGIGAFSIELRDAGGQLLLSAGPGTRLGLPRPQPFARVPQRTGALFTVRGVGGSYLVIAEPVHYLARRLAYGYGADDFVVTSGSRDGTEGTLVVGLQTDGIGRTVGRLTRLGLAVSAAVVLIAAGLAWAAIRFSLRPVTRVAQTADAFAADAGAAGRGDEDSSVTGRRPVRIPGRPVAAGDGLAGSLNQLLGQLEARLTASAGAETAACSATDQLGRAVESMAEALRRPVSLLHGQAEHWAHQDRRSTADADRAMDQVATETARAEALLDEASQLATQTAHAEALLDEAGDALFTDPVRPDPGNGRTGPVKSRQEPRSL